MPIEYRDYNLTLDSERPWVNCRHFSVTGAQHEFWAIFREKATRDLFDLAQEGWVPVDKDLVSGVEIRRYRGSHPSGFGIILLILWVLSTFGLGLLFAPWIMTDDFYEPTGYHLQLGRKR